MKAIVVVDKNWGIGKNGGLLFRLKKDMEFFRKTTLNKVVVMGAKTYASFPHGALPDRTNIVLDDSGARYPDAQSVASVDDLHALLSQYEPDDVFVIGGASVYRLLLDDCNEAYVTKVDAVGNADCFFPNLDEMSWWVGECGDEIEDNGYVVRFCKYRNTKLI